MGAVDVASSATAVLDSDGFAIVVVAADADADADGDTALVAVGDREALAAGEDAALLALGDALVCAAGVVGDAQADNRTANASTTSRNERTGRMVKFPFFPVNKPIKRTTRA